jgi:hypothetical protein
VGEDVHPVESQVRAQGLHVGHEPVAAVRARIGRCRGVARAAQVEQDQAPVRGETAQVTEVGGGLHGAAGQDDERGALASQVVGELGPVGSGEGRHAPIFTGGGTAPQRSSRKCGQTSCLRLDGLNY